MKEESQGYITTVNLKVNSKEKEDAYKVLTESGTPCFIDRVTGKVYSVDEVEFIYKEENE